MLGKMRAWVVAGAMTLVGAAVLALPVVNAGSVYAAECTEDQKKAGNCVDTNILDNDGGIEGLLSLIVNILLYGLGAAATLGVVIAGIMYLTARDNPQQVAKAKTRLIEISIGLAAWAMLFALLQFLLPGFDGI